MDRWPWSSSNSTISAYPCPLDTVQPSCPIAQAVPCSTLVRLFKTPSYWKWLEGLAWTSSSTNCLSSLTPSCPIPQAHQPALKFILFLLSSKWHRSRSSINCVSTLNTQIDPLIQINRNSDGLACINWLSLSSLEVVQIHPLIQINWNSDGLSCINCLSTLMPPRSTALLLLATLVKLVQQGNYQTTQYIDRCEIFHRLLGINIDHFLFALSCVKVFYFHI